MAHDLYDRDFPALDPPASGVNDFPAPGILARTPKDFWHVHAAERQLFLRKIISFFHHQLITMGELQAAVRRHQVLKSAVLPFDVGPDDHRPEWVQDILNLLQSHGNQLGNINATLQNIDVTLQSHGNRLDNIDVTLRAHGNRLDNIDATLRAHGNRLDNIDATLRAHGNQLDNIDVTLQSHGNQLGALNNRSIGHMGQLQGLRRMVDTETDAVRNLSNAIQAVRVEQGTQTRLLRLVSQSLNVPPPHMAEIERLSNLLQEPDDVQAGNANIQQHP